MVSEHFGDKIQHDDGRGQDSKVRALRPRVLRVCSWRAPICMSHGYLTTNQRLNPCTLKRATRFAVHLSRHTFEESKLLLGCIGSFASLLRRSLAPSALSTRWTLPLVKVTMFIDKTLTKHTTNEERIRKEQEKESHMDQKGVSVFKNAR